MFGNVFFSMSPCSLLHLMLTPQSSHAPRQGPRGQPSSSPYPSSPSSRSSPARTRRPHPIHREHPTPHSLLTPGIRLIRTPHLSVPPTSQQLDKTRAEEPTSRSGLPVPALLAIVAVSRTSLPITYTQRNSRRKRTRSLPLPPRRHTSVHVRPALAREPEAR